jgi:hypothetical protein
MPNDDECVLLYLEIAQCFHSKSPAEKLHILRTIETHYDSESDTELGDFINNIFALCLQRSQDDDLHSYIRDEIYDSDLDYGLVFSVGTTILSTVYLGEVMM